MEYICGPIAKEAHESHARVKYLWGPLGTAKTTWLCWRVYGMARRCSALGLSLRAILVRDTYRNLADSTLKTWLHWFPDRSKYGYLKHSVPADYILFTPDGREHEVMFRHGQTAQDASLLLSTEYGLIGLEEVAPAYLPDAEQLVSPGISEEFFNMAYSRLRQQGLTEPELAITSNPPSRAHWSSRRIIDASGNDRHGAIEREIVVEGIPSLVRWEHWFTPVTENRKNLRFGYYEELTATWPRILVRRFVEGERVDMFIGIPRFDLDALDAMKNGNKDKRIEPYAREPGFRGFLLPSDDNLLHVKPDPNPSGYVRMWAPPKGGHEYVIGADVAEGLEGRDYSSAHVLDRSDLSIAATWHGHIEPEKFGKEELPKLGKAYGNALIGVESNNHGLATLIALRNTGYQRIFWQVRTDTRSRKTERIGWRTDRATKPLMIDQLANFLAEGGQIVDGETIQELMTYGVNDRGETEAQAGCHDDRLVSLAIAIQMTKYGGLEKIFPSLGKKAA